MPTRCPHCGTDVPDAARFCFVCGKTVTALSDDAVTAETTVHETTPPPSSRPGTRPPASSVQFSFEPGAVINDRYRIIDRMGQGGMGVVYRADDLTLEQPVALKFLPPELALHPHRLERFLSEVRTARQVSHANVCRVYDIGSFESERGTEHFISMELVEGEDLSSLIRRIGRFSPDKGTEIARQVCAGLGAAHERGIVHRDLKPANIMLDADGRVRITDFGIASLVEEITERDRTTGTPQYMSPEQLAGRPLDKRSDIFSLGLVLYEIFTGERYVSSKTIADIQREHESGTHTQSSQTLVALDPAIERVIQHCLEFEPSQRPQSAFAVAAALPGGDPLAAALAAGETPSPELLASAGIGRAMSPVLACVLILIGALCTFAIMLLNTDRSFLARIDMPKPRDVLIDNAREISESLGYPATDHTAFGWRRNEGYLLHLKNEDDTASRWAPLSERRPAPMFFWYRHHTSPLVARNGMRQVDQVDPPITDPGMVFLRTSGDGLLETFFVALPRITRAQAQDPVEPDWNPVFELAGLDFEEFVDLDETFNSPQNQEFSRAWKGPLPGNEDIEVRVYAGSYGGKVSTFKLRYPWEDAWFEPGSPTLGVTDAEEEEPEPTGAANLVEEAAEGVDTAQAGTLGEDLVPPDSETEVESAGLEEAATVAAESMGEVLRRIAGLFSVGVIGSLVVLAVFFAYRHLKTGRGDLNGALRSGLIIFVTLGTAQLLQSTNPPFFLTMIFGQTLHLASAALIALLIFVFYLAVEPFARRYWPNTMVNWVKVGAGKVRDPSVGRDMLLGLAFGGLVTVLAAAGFAGHYFGNIPLDDLPYPGGTNYFHGIPMVLGNLGNEAANAFLSSLLTLLLLALFRFVLRFNIAAIIALFILALVINTGLDFTDPYRVASQAVINLGVILLVLRYGLLTMFVTMFVSRTIGTIPFGTDWDMWYSTPIFVPLGVLVLIAIFGFMTATSGRSFSAPTGARS